MYLVQNLSRRSRMLRCQPDRQLPKPLTVVTGDVTSSIFVGIGIDDQVTFVIAETTLIYLPSRILWPKGLIAEMLLSGGRSVK